MKTITRALLLATFAFAAIACGMSAGSSSTGGVAGVGDGTGTGAVMGAVDATGASYLDPAAAFFAANANVAANANTLNANGTTNPNCVVCMQDLQTLLADDANLLATAEVQAAANSNEYLAVVAAMEVAHQDGCKSILTASTLCQKDITALDAAVQAFWASPAFVALQATPAYQAVQADIAAIVAANCVADLQKAANACHHDHCCHN